MSTFNSNFSLNAAIRTLCLAFTHASERDSIRSRALGAVLQWPSARSPICGIRTTRSHIFNMLLFVDLISLLHSHFDFHSHFELSGAIHSLRWMREQFNIFLNFRIVLFARKCARNGILLMQCDQNVCCARSRTRSHAPSILPFLAVCGKTVRSGTFVLQFRFHFKCNVIGNVFSGFFCECYFAVVLYVPFMFELIPIFFSFCCCLPLNRKAWMAKVLMYPIWKWYAHTHTHLLIFICWPYSHLLVHCA